VHAHLLSAELVEQGFGAPSGTPASTADDLIGRLDEANVDRAIVLSIAYLREIPEELMRSENDWVAAEVAKYPDRLIGFCGINPLQESALEEIERCLELPGMVGVKLHADASGFDWEDAEHVDALSQVLDEAGARDVPALIHLTGVPLNRSGVLNVFRILGTHPDVRLTLAHCAGLAEWELDLLLIASRTVPQGLSLENLFLDTSFCLEMYKDAPLTQRELMVWRLREWGIERVFFGSDYLMVAPVATPQGALETLSMYPFTQEEIDIILSNDGSAWLQGQ
jgi:predicted TIM-barrel fold metal-dependent hydrolase